GILVKSFDKIKGIPGKFKKGKSVSKQNVSDSKKEKASDKIHSLLVKKNIIEEDIENDMLLFEDDLNDDENEELKRDIPEDDEELEEMFSELINEDEEEIDDEDDDEELEEMFSELINEDEEEIDDEESDDLDELEIAEYEDDLQVIDSDHPDYDQLIVADRDEVVITNVANSDSEICVVEDYLLEDEKDDDEDKKQPG